jgi:serine/threonine protein phosphatase 1
MNFFVIADVHGCFHTLRELLKHWRPAEEVLVQLGDLIDRGNFSPETVELCRYLSHEFSEQTIFLLGNHDWGMAQHRGPNRPFFPWLEWGGRETLLQYQEHYRAWLAPHAAWLAARPLFWQNDYVLFSHAGFAGVEDELNPTNNEGVLWRRGQLCNTGKLQVVGHTPTRSHKLERNTISNTIYLDTGAVAGHGLTGLRLSPRGEVLQAIKVPTVPDDIYSSDKLAYV